MNEIPSAYANNERKMCNFILKSTVLKQQQGISVRNRVGVADFTDRALFLTEQVADFK